MPSAGRVIAGTSGSPGSIAALRYADALARAYETTLVPVLAWVPPGGDRADRSQPSGYLRHVWHDLACKRLGDALIAVWGEVPDDPNVQPHVERGPAGWVLVSIACRPGDLLVVGAGRRGLLRPDDRLQGDSLLRRSCPMPGAGHPPASSRPRNRPWLARTGGPPPDADPGAGLPGSRRYSPRWLAIVVCAAPRICRRTRNWRLPGWPAPRSGGPPQRPRCACSHRRRVVGENPSAYADGRIRACRATSRVAVLMLGSASREEHVGEVGRGIARPAATFRPEEFGCQA